MIIFLGNTHSNKLYEKIIENSKKDDKDIVVSCQYPFLVPESLLNNYTCVNIHYGLLPIYAGCNPVFWQMVEGDTAGVTLHYMDKGFDSGDIIDTFEIPTCGMVANEVYEELADRGRELFLRHYEGILNGTAPREKQDLSIRQYRNKHEVNFNKVNIIPKQLCDTAIVRAVHFKDKQYPIIELSGRKFELRAL